jgi:hypothetical protein
MISNIYSPNRHHNSSYDISFRRHNQNARGATFHCQKRARDAGEEKPQHKKQKAESDDEDEDSVEAKCNMRMRLSKVPGKDLFMFAANTAVWGHNHEVKKCDHLLISSKELPPSDPDFRQVIQQYADDICSRVSTKEECLFVFSGMRRISHVLRH